MNPMEELNLPYEGNESVQKFKMKLTSGVNPALIV